MSDGDKVIDIEKVCSLFQKYNSNPNSLDLFLYIEAYRELKRFLDIFGKVFHFVTKDIESKLNLLDGYMKDESLDKNYQTLQSMVEYERKNNLLKKDDRPSGARTLLRLHRALEFISLFTNEIAKLSTQEACGPAARRSYHKTLAKYHPWIVKQAANVALYALPAKHDLAARALGQTRETCDIDACNCLMSKLSDISETSFNVTQKFYEDNSLLDLP